MANNHPKKKNNPMQKVGQGLKNTFIEMSESLAGWIDDTGAQFTKEMQKSKQRVVENRTPAAPTKTATKNTKTTNKPQLEK